MPAMAFSQDNIRVRVNGDRGTWARKKPMDA